MQHARGTALQSAKLPSKAFPYATDTVPRIHAIPRQRMPHHTLISRLHAVSTNSHARCPPPLLPHSSSFLLRTNTPLVTANLLPTCRYRTVLVHTDTQLVLHAHHISSSPLLLSKYSYSPLKFTPSWSPPSSPFPPLIGDHSIFPWLHPLTDLSVTTPCLPDPACSTHC